MRPERPDIAAPPFPPGLEWIGAEPASMERLCAKGPVLVHFFEASAASSVRSLDWIKTWHERYEPLGLKVIGVHTPRSGFAAASADLGNVSAWLGIRHPVANDCDRHLWRDYGCKGWPSLFLWRRGGSLVWAHFGEGAYQATERAIRAELGDRAGALPDPAEPSRRSDAEGATVVPPTPEIFPGGSHDVPFEGGTGEPLVVSYEAGACYLAASGSGQVGGTLDGRRLDPLAVEGPLTVALAEHGSHGRHELSLEPGLGIRVWAIGFGAGVP